MEEEADDFPILVTPWLAAIKQQEQIWLETCPNPHFPVSTKGKKVRCTADINMSNLGIGRYGRSGLPLRPRIR